MAVRRRIRRPRPHRQSGVAAVEFALVAVFIFLPLLLGITSFGRWLYTLNAASEATRYGARVAVVCDQDDSTIRARMRTFLPQTDDANISISYSPAGCTAAACHTVPVSLSGLTVPILFWFAPPETTRLLPSYPVPAFAHTLTRESMRSEIDGSGNPVCN